MIRLLIYFYISLRFFCFLKPFTFISVCISLLPFFLTPASLSLSLPPSLRSSLSHVLWHCIIFTLPVSLPLLLLLTRTQSVSHPVFLFIPLSSALKSSLQPGWLFFSDSQIAAHPPLSLWEPYVSDVQFSEGRLEVSPVLHYTHSLRDVACLSLQQKKHRVPCGYHPVVDAGWIICGQLKVLR